MVLPVTDSPAVGDLASGETVGTAGIARLTVPPDATGDERKRVLSQAPSGLRTFA